MIGILEFDLPQEQEEFKLAQKGLHLDCVIESIMLYLRQKRKYENETTVNIEELEEYIRQELEAD